MPQWRQVVIPASDVADVTLTALANKYAAALRAEIAAHGKQENSLPVIKTVEGNHIVIFPPTAYAIASAAGIFVEIPATELPGPPDLTGFTIIKA